jgi:hypothetical protein
MGCQGCGKEFSPTEFRAGFGFDYGGFVHNAELSQKSRIKNQILMFTYN